uniref:UBC core domain-containing protein n=1 Tax=Oryza punctata TaxID=4537 RepID=A0A0E0KYL8_ORYPU
MAGVEAAAAQLHHLDLVRFEAAEGDEKKHGDHGLVLYTEPKTTVMCIDGAVVDTKDGALVVVVDRSSLYPGMHVTSASDPAGQIGVVTAVSTAVDLVEHRANGDYGDAEAAAAARGVSPSGLRRVTEFSLGDYVVSGQWLGRVVEVCVAVDVVFDDGAVCRITGDRAQNRVVGQITTHMYRRRGMNCAFYPGQRVTGHHMLASPAIAFKDARWLRGYWKLTRLEGTVAKVAMTGVLVYWIASAQLGTNKNLINASAPPAFQHPNDLTLFCSDDVCPWAFGDRCFIAAPPRRHRRRRPRVPTDDDKQEASPPATTAAAEQDVQETSEAQVEKKEKPYRNQLRKFFFKRDKRATRWGGRAPAVDKVMLVSGTRTSADVLWQDGTLRRGVPSLELVPFNILNDHEFFPGQQVVVDTMAAAATTARRVGVVRSVDPKDQTVRVSWLEEEAERGGEETVASAYDLRMYSRDDVFYGDVVVRLLPPPPEQAAGAGDGTPPAAQGSEAATAAADLSWVGRVVDVRDGHVQVRWGNGETSTAVYHEVRAVDMRNFMMLEYEVGPWLAEERDRAAAQAQPPPPPPPPPAAANNNAGNNNNNVANARAAGNTARPAAAAPAPPPPTLIVRVSAAVRRVFDAASQLLAQGKSYLVTISSSSSSSAVAAAAATATGNAEAPPPSGPSAGGDVNVEPAPAAPAAGNGVAGEDATAAADLPSSSDAGGGDGDGDGDDSAGDGEGKEKVDEESLGFAHFEVVQCPPDHHYLDCKLEGAAHGNKWVKRVQKEWQILGDDNLPGSIYVRAFEDRMDLLRAAMVGAAGTPYHDGLFLFDIHLQPSYPAAPPEVYYHSFGLRVNPNLYPSGTICLSLLNTFDGEGVEVWSPASSTLLQVLVSIQGLVLTVDPYYNEAGYEAYVGTPEGRRNAFSYAENSYLLTLRSALHLLRRSPRGFEDIIRGHFRRRGKHVLAACESYMRGSRVAGDGGDGERTCSTGFRLALGNVVPLLAAAFMEIGVEGCEQFGDGEVGQCSHTAIDNAPSADASN